MPLSPEKQILELLDRKVRIVPRDGYLFIWHGRAAKDLEELGIVLRGIERMLRAHRVSLLLFDSRESEQAPIAVQALLWSWLEEKQFAKVATLVTSPNLAVSVRMTGLTKKIRIMAFDSELAAERWLKAR